MMRFASQLLAAVLLANPAAAIAETVVQDVTVTALAAAECTVVGGTLDFGIYEPDSGAGRTATAQIGLDCSSEGVLIAIRLDSGRHPDGGERRMMGGHGHFLRYNLYTERLEPRQVWGDGITFGQPVITSFSSMNPSRPVFGELPAGQQVPPGSYTDIVTITVTVEPNLTH